jgi:dihydroxyacetone kinase-like protein
MKKLINSPDRLVDEALAGVALAHADLVRVESPNIVVRRDAPRPGKVGVISGGGSGHEPMHGGFVGRGMLDAACPGAVFTSPVPDQMLAATQAVNGGAGVLHIVKNYTGDIMNFELAAELAKAEGIDVEAVVIADDVAVKDSLYTRVAAAWAARSSPRRSSAPRPEEGADLATVKALCEGVQANVRSMGMALTSCTVPAAGKPTFDIGDDEMEIGIGIHGEPGRERRKLATADEITEMLAIPIIDDLPFKSGDRVLAFVNGMGGTPLLELYVIYRKLAEILDGRGVQIARSLVGNYITVARDGGLLDHPAQARRRVHPAVGRTGHTPALRWGV